MKTIYSHTIVKNGQPFIGVVLKQVLPFVDKALVTVSRKSNDGTLKVIEDLADNHSNKIEVFFEDVDSPAELTEVRAEQLDRTEIGSWVLFLDEDDLWPTKSLETMVGMLDEDVDAFAVNPFQLIDKNSYDYSWRYKWFTKWFRNEPGTHYRGDWPRDLIYLNNKILYWRKNDRVRRVEPRFFHLSYLKNESFRDLEWAKEFKQSIGTKKDIPQEYKVYIKDMLDSY